MGEYFTDFYILLQVRARIAGLATTEYQASVWAGWERGKCQRSEWFQMVKGKLPP